VASVEVARRTAAALGLVATDRPARRRPRIGVLTSSLDTASAEVAGPVRQALARLQQAGFELTDLHWPHTDLVAAVSTTVMFAEAAHSHLASLEGDPNSIGADVRGRLLRGRSIGATAYLAGRQLVDQLSALFSAFFQQVDVVAGPTTRIAAPLLSEADDPGVAAALVRYTRLDDLTGFPAMSLPVATAGLPVGMHLTGLTDEGLLDAAAALEPVVSGPRSR
jgi:aspartyl-tRNA(Asn)/glutamyl-tRNA(Gln) amidotransferase subunit A